MKGLKQVTDDLVLIGLQEVPKSHRSRIDSYFEGYSVYHDGDYPHLINTLVVCNKLDLQVVNKDIILPNPVGLPDRYANIVYFPAIKFKVANTHILGGRFDDPIDSNTWKNYPEARTKQMQAILDKKPTVVMGDFNGERPPNVDQYVWDNPPTHQDFEYGVHVVLAKRGYIPCLTKEEMGPMCWAPCSKTPDWIYGAKTLSQEIVAWGVIKAMDNNFSLSDHNFIWVRIRVNLP